MAIHWSLRIRARELGAVVSLLLVVALPSHAAKYAGDPFSLGVGARPLALGGATVAGPFDATAAYWNPAGMNMLDGRYVVAMHAETFGSLLNHDYVSYINSRKRDSSLIGAWGAYVYYLGGGGIKITQLDQNNRPFVIREESHGDYLFAGAVAGRVNDRIDFGFAGKVIYRDVGTETGIGLTVDAGALYRIHKYVTLGLTVTDCTSGFIKYSHSTVNDGDSTITAGGNSESIYPTVRPGVMLEYSWRDFTGRAMFTGDIKFESLKSTAQLWAGPFSMDTHYGWEIGWRNLVFGRAGFDIGHLTMGAGVAVRKFSVDFAYLHNPDFDATFRVSGSYHW
jgi:hypothetical protein